MLRFKYRIYIIFFLFIPVFSTCASGNNKTVDTSSVIQVRDNLLTVKVRDIPLRKVLMEIAKQTPIKIVFYASAEENLVTDFSGLPMEKGLKKLLRDYNYTFTYGSEESKDGGHEIRKVIILSNTGGSQHRRTEPMLAYTEEPSLEPLNIVQYDEDTDIREEHMLEPFGESEGATSIGLPTGGLLNDEDEDLRLTEEEELRDIESEIDPLIDILQDEEAEVRLIAVEALGEIGGDKAIQVLEEALEDEDEAVREMAAEGLRRLKGEG